MSSGYASLGLTETAAEKMLNSLGIEVLSSRNEELLGRCPAHKERTGREDHNPSWWFNFETGMHFCFSCGYKGRLVTLVVERLSLKTKWGLPDLESAESWIQGFSTFDLSKASETLSRAVEYSAPLPKPVEMSEARLAVYDEPPAWALKARKLTAEACAYYTVKWCSDTNAWITPIRDPENGKLWGWQMKGEKERSFMNRPSGVKKSKTMFGIDKWVGGLMVVVESPLDAVRLRSAGIEGAVATYGAVVSQEQVALMKSADELVIAMDNPSIDDAGAKAVKQIFEASRKYGFDFSCFDYGNSDIKDVGDMLRNDILEGFENKKHSVHGLSTLLGGK